MRVEIDDSSDTMRAKIRRHQLLKAPYLLVVGDDEIAADSVSVRRRFSRDSRALPADEFASALAAEIDERAVEPRV